MNADAARILERAAELVEQGWAQRFFAYDSYGQRVAPTSDDAVEWCALGALDRAWHDLGAAFAVEKAEERLDAEVGRRGHYSITTWNDEPGRTADEVAALMREAAASLREREPAGAVA